MESAISELRKKISRDMHDELSGSLAGLKYYVNDLRLKEKDLNVKQMLENIEKEVSTVYNQAREYMHKLNEGPEKASGDMNVFLQTLTHEFSLKYELKINLNINKEEIECGLSIKQQAQLTLIIKESLTNAIKHSGASHLNINIWFSESTCFFNLSDNGKGFNINSTKKGMGVLNMQLRVEEMKGMVSVKSSPKGTVIEGSFPIDKKSKSATL